MNSSRTAPESHTLGPIKDHYEFEAPDRVRTLMRVMLGALVVALFAATVNVVNAGTHLSVLVFVGVLACLVLLWTMLASRNPQLITVNRSIITIRRGARTASFDLVDPNLQISVKDGHFAFVYYDGRHVGIRPSEVDWSTFLNVVMHYQNYADVKAVEKERRFKR